MSCQPAHARFYLQSVDADRTSSNIRRTRGSESVGTPDEEGLRYKSRRETEPFPRRVRHLQRKLNDSAQFARTRSMRCTFASPPYILELQGCRLPSFPRSRLYPSIKILEGKTHKKVMRRNRVKTRLKPIRSLRFKRDNDIISLCWWCNPLCTFQDHHQKIIASFCV